MRKSVGGLILKGREANPTFATAVNADAYVAVNGNEPIVLANAILGLEGQVVGYVETWEDCQEALSMALTEQPIEFAGASFTGAILKVSFTTKHIKGEEYQYHLTFDVIGGR